MTEPAIVIERDLSAPPAEVFAAWGDPESLRLWMIPADLNGATVEADFRVGGSFRIVMHGDERDYVQHGEYLEIDAPKRIVMTWVSEWMPPGEQHTRLSVTFERAADGGTHLRLVHDELPATESYEGHRNGWSSIVERLAARLDD